MQVEVPLGDIVDKVTILEIKRRKLDRPESVANVERELSELRNRWSNAGYPEFKTLPQWHSLRQVNEALWNVEDDLRAMEHQKRFDEDFIAKARSVYRLNDERAALKRQINISLGSTLVEEKSYHTGSAEH